MDMTKLEIKRLQRFGRGITKEVRMNEKVLIIWIMPTAL